MGFIISRKARDKYNFDKALFKPQGKVAFKNAAEIQQFAAKLKSIKVRAGEINAMDLLHDIFHHVIHLYIEQQNPQMLAKALEQLQKELDKETLDSALSLFADQFPAAEIYDGLYSPSEYLEGSTAGVPHRYTLLEELLLLWLTNANPACRSYRNVLFSDGELKNQSAYPRVIMELERFFSFQPFFGPAKENLVAMLRAPAIAVPNSLPGQLAYIREHWGYLLGEFLSRLLSGLDLLKEEEKFGGMGPGETVVYDFSTGSLDEEYERFSRDYAWMPRLVLMAKSTYVWLDQLSKKYQRHISRLDQIPDEELDELGDRGFTGLWLIGLWERSRASQRIKQMCGNPEALASAYSIFQYRVAEELGGEEALNHLKHRAWQRGIRMASDMVPNHMGIDSPWLVEHPEWFLSLDYCPYPSYSFNGPDLSGDQRVSIFLEDHYYDRTDAAVVFKWVNNHSGEVRYIYHGNDGTSMPWNDTAQLNYLHPDTREAVTRTIFSVAEKFPIIRFDAAMTLTKRHYQRLWFPEPGSGGDIPSRGWQGITVNEFNQQMPEEFWRQVVDRFAAANSDTLLLAEAFWLMEAYFVRTLGMHRVYNSAFMNFLKNEENNKFRASIKNILQFNPEILKRFVNFMNNPDEETAVAQFGKGDKYIGVCILMVTLPGLPMFGHGQIEGFTEKYGMEYRRAYWDETPDAHLVRRHEREIFPLMKRRYLFADVEGFLFYDFFTAEGWVNEDVIAYSNRFAGECGLVIYHNKFAETTGWIKSAVPFLSRTDSEDRQTRTELAPGLGLTPRGNYFTLFRDQITGLEYIRSSIELFEKGLYVELRAFKYNVFLDFREVEEDERGTWGQLAAMLQGKGVPNLEAARRTHFFNPLRDPFSALINPVLFQHLKTALLFPSPRINRNANLQNPNKGFDQTFSKVWPPAGPPEAKPPQPDSQALIEKTKTKLAALFEAVQQLTGVSQGKGKPASLAEHHVQKLERWLVFISRADSHSPEIREALQYMTENIREADLAWFFLYPLGELVDQADPGYIWQFLEEWLLTGDLSDPLMVNGLSPEQLTQRLNRLEIMIRWSGWWREREENRWKQWIDAFFSDPGVRAVLGVNFQDNTLWFHQESGEEMIQRLFMMAIFGFPGPGGEVKVERGPHLLHHYRLLQQMLAALHQSAYRLEGLTRILKTF